MNDVILVRAPAHELERLSESAREALDAPLIDEWSDAHRGFALLVSTPLDAPRRLVARGKRQVLAYAGYLSDYHEAGVFPIEPRFANGRLSLPQSPGGIASYYLVDKVTESAFLWSSLGSVSAIYYGTHGDLFVAGNRPVLVRRTLFPDRPVRPNSVWCQRALANEYSLWDDTPVDGVRLLEPRRTLVVGRHSVNVEYHPLQVNCDRFPDRDPNALDDYVAELRGSVSVLKVLPTAEFRLSAGKDSRLLAALLHDRNISVDCATYGQPDEFESPLAKRVADHARLPHRFIEREVAQGPELLSQIRENLRGFEGFLGEPRHLCLRPIATARGVPEIEGHAHHARGGLNTRFQSKLSVIRDKILSAFSPESALISPELHGASRARVLELLERYAVPHPMDLIYWMYADLRMGHWLSGSWLSYNKRGPVIWPLMDERVLATVMRLSTWDRASEYLFYAALERLAPKLAHLPLFDTVWRFDRGGRDETPFPDQFEMRANPVRPAVPKRPTVNRKRIKFIYPAFKEAVHSFPAAAREVGEVAAPGVWRAVTTSDLAITEAGLATPETMTFLWRATSLILVAAGAVH